MYFMDGNEAIAHAAVQAGCDFFAGYPITPATPIFQHMLGLLPPAGGVCMQGEDEIGSMGFCLGASMAGRKVMTATSGPGISLISEQISFAIGGEIPVVIVDVQRLGPSTGAATKGADGDIQFLRWGNSGGLPVIVLAPVDVADCYILTVHAFNLAEQYRCPVFIASNKEVAMTRESVDLDRLQLPNLVERKYCPDEIDFLPFDSPGQSAIPYFLPIGGKRLVRQTSSTHGPDGYITIDTDIIAANISRMATKLENIADEEAYYEADEQDGAGRVLLVYGVTARAAREAVTTLRRNGVRISLLILKRLYPVPVNLLKRFFTAYREVVVIEMNMGQYVLEIERICIGVTVQSHTEMNGELISPETIMEVCG